MFKDVSIYLSRPDCATWEDACDVSMEFVVHNQKAGGADVVKSSDHFFGAFSTIKDWGFKDMGIKGLTRHCSPRRDYMVDDIMVVSVALREKFQGTLVDVAD